MVMSNKTILKQYFSKNILCIPINILSTQRKCDKKIKNKIIIK